MAIQGKALQGVCVCAVCGTGTHDNETTVGWWNDSAQDAEKEYIKRYLHTSGKDIAGDFMRESFKSVSKTSIVMLQVIWAAFKTHESSHAASSQPSRHHKTSFLKWCLCSNCTGSPSCAQGGYQYRSFMVRHKVCCLVHNFAVCGVVSRLVNIGEPHAALLLPHKHCLQFGPFVV